MCGAVGKKGSQGVDGTMWTAQVPARTGTAAPSFSTTGEEWAMSHLLFPENPARSLQMTGSSFRPICVTHVFTLNENASLRQCLFLGVIFSLFCPTLILWDASWILSWIMQISQYHKLKMALSSFSLVFECLMLSRHTYTLTSNW